MTDTAIAEIKALTEEIRLLRHALQELRFNAQDVHHYHHPVVREGGWGGTHTSSYAYNCRLGGGG